MERRALLHALLSRDPAEVPWPRDPEGWDALLDDARALGALGLLHAALRRAGDAAGAPPATRDAARRAHAATAAQNLELLAAAEEVLHALGAAGVTAAPMKGVALFREQVVVDLGARPTTDVDLAICREDTARATAALTSRGFLPSATEASFKHLPPLRRGDVAVELHTVAYWSGATRRSFGAPHLASPDRTTRLARLWALAVHHLVLGSPPDAGLLVRTLGDLAALARVAEKDAALARAAERALSEAGLAREGGACDALLSEARDAPRVLALPAPPDAVEALVAPLEAPAGDPRELALGHLLATLRRQPLEMTVATVALLLWPPRGAVEAAERGGSVGWARLRRPAELSVRVARALPKALPRALRRRPGGR